MRTTRFLLCAAIVASTTAALTATSVDAAPAGTTVADTAARLDQQAKVQAYAQEHGATAASFAADMPGANVQSWGAAHDAIGTYLSAKTNSYVVALSKTAAPTASPPDFDGQPVTVRRSATSKAEVDDTETRIIRFAQGAGHANAFTFDYDPDRDAVVVSTDAPAELRSELGHAAPAAVIESSPTPLKLQSGDQFADKTPHYGGARITTATIGNCTSAFSMVNNAGNHSSYSVTAAHCTRQGYNVASGQYYFGTVTSVAPTDRYDIAKIEWCCAQQNYVGLIYTSRYNSIQVNGASAPAIGHPGLTGACVAGGFTGERCGASIISTTATGCVPGFGCIPALIKYGKNTNEAMTQGGDSGAPLYYHEGHTNLAHVVGMHIGAGVNNNVWAGYAESYIAVALLTNGTIRRFTG
ncbi:hypothetical protein [Kutzneria chonburiensis]|uniref:Serine protease n=1 Tax=Kutzneria chonburiensis TaxID=1483604 RepID=A0ABV6MNG2_9PSEU|nr:hypothetical protein [Kutzneria chonburiensis]